MKKQILMILVVVGMLLMSGCESIQCNGFSIGATYLNSELLTHYSINAGPFGQWEANQETKIEGLMPMFLFNFKFK